MDSALVALYVGVQSRPEAAQKNRRMAKLNDDSASGLGTPWVKPGKRHHDGDGSGLRSLLTLSGEAAESRRRARSAATSATTSRCPSRRL